MEIQSTMYQILDTLVPWWHLAQVTSKGESHLLGVHSGSYIEQLNKSSHIHIATKVKLFNTTCVTILLYVCDSWVISQDMENKINAFATSCYRVMLNIKSIDHVLNTTVYSMTKTVPLIHLVRHRQLKFFGHILRMSKGKSLLEGMLCTSQPLAKGDLVTTYFIPYLCTKIAWG